MLFLLRAFYPVISSSSVPVGIIQLGYSTLLLRKSGPTTWHQRLPTPTRHLVRTILGHTDWVRYVVPSDDGRLLASASKDQVADFPTLFASVALKNMLDRLLDFGTRLRVNKRWSFGVTITKLRLWSLPRSCPTVPFASLRAFQFVHVASYDCYLTLDLEYGSGKEAWRVCRHGFERQDNQALGHSKWPDAEKPRRVPLSIAHESVSCRSARPDMTTGSELSFSIPRGNCYFPPLTTRRYVYGNCQPAGV